MLFHPDTRQVRRFQIKFASDQDYYTTLAILSNINCPFSESNVGPPQPVRRPTASTQWRSGSVASPAPSAASETLPSGPGVAALPAFSNAFFPPHSASMTGFPGLSSNTIGNFLHENCKNDANIFELQDHYSVPHHRALRTRLQTYHPTILNCQTPTWDHHLNLHCSQS